MKTRTIRRAAASLTAAGLAALALAAPTAATAAPLVAEDDALTGACVVDTGALGWGMKESFRTYITGSIAHGSWETSEGVTYIEPALSDTGAIEPGTDLFEWSAASGAISPDLVGGTVSFTGNVHFTGHDGALSLNIGDPGIEFIDAETAYLLLAIGEAPAGEQVPQVKAAKIELAGNLSIDGQTLSIAGAPVILTAEGAEAFNGGRGSYTSGEEMDPVFLETTVSGCELGAVAAEPTPEDEPATDEVVTTQEEAQDQAAFPWVPIIIGAVALVVVVAAAVLLITGRPKKGPGTTDPGAGAPDEGSPDA